nr:MAG TPA: hypothetical protein [Caudoviricetes sp.]
MLSGMILTDFRVWKIIKKVVDKIVTAIVI